VAVSEPTAQRSSLARKLGADIVLNPLKDDVVAECHRLSNGAQGVDVAFDAAGTERTVAAAIASIRPRGVVVNIVCAFYHFSDSLRVRWLKIRKQGHLGKAGLD
jgi:threonine dehydrogenase-like Zn-dependent dehydrogenase